MTADRIKVSVFYDPGLQVALENIRPSILNDVEIKVIIMP